MLASIGFAQIVRQTAFLLSGKNILYAVSKEILINYVNYSFSKGSN